MCSSVLSTLTGLVKGLYQTDPGSSLHSTTRTEGYKLSTSFLHLEGRADGIDLPHSTVVRTQGEMSVKVACPQQTDYFQIESIHTGMLLVQSRHVFCCWPQPATKVKLSWGIVCTPFFNLYANLREMGSRLIVKWPTDDLCRVQELLARSMICPWCWFDAFYFKKKIEM